MALALPLTSPELAASYRAAGLWKDVTIAERFLAAATAHPEKRALILGDQAVTYDQLRQRVERTAAGLLDLGLNPGDVVAGQLPNGVEIPQLHLACNLVGLLFMPLHDSWRELEVKHLLRQAKVKALVTPAVYRDFDYRAMVDGIRADAPELIAHYVLGPPQGESLSFESLAQCEPLDAAVIETLRPDPDMPAAIMLSGGTTAISKISRYSSNDLLRLLEVARETGGFTEDDIAGALAPAETGATGYVYPILLPLVNGATSAILPRWSDPDEAVDLLVRHACTYAVAIPAQLVKLVPALRARGREAFALRVVANAGAPLPYDTAVAVEELTGAVIQSMYGATDGGTPTMTRVTDPREKRLRTVGHTVDGCECEIRAVDTGAPLGPNETGEVVWRSPDKSWGYLGDDAQTAAVFTADHFYRSGDLGQFDSDGYLRIVGRIKDMVLRGGRNVSPLAIEERLIRHPAVADVAVAPMPDPVLGERACAFVVRKPGESIDLQSAVSFLKNEGLAVWQLPERLEVLEELPRSAGGKTLKRDLTAMITAKLHQESS